VGTVNDRPAIGAIIADDGSARLVPLPEGEHQLLAPRISFQEGGTWEVSWLSPAHDTVVGSFTDADIKVAQFNGTSWIKPVIVGHLEQTFTGPDLPSRFVRSRNGESGFAYPLRSLKPGGAIMLIVRQGDGWQHREIPTVHSALYVTLAMSDASIVVAYVGADANEQNGLFVTRSTDMGGTWSDPIMVARGRGYWPQLTRVGSSLALLWIGEEQPFHQRGLHIAVSHDTGASWAASQPIQGGEDATTFAIAALAGQNTAIVADEGQQPHKAYRVGVLTTTSLTWLSRDSVDAILPPMMTLGDGGDAVVMWSGVDRTQRNASFTMMRMRVRCASK
jgi:hypothetical protein